MIPGSGSRPLPCAGSKAAASGSGWNGAGVLSASAWQTSQDLASVPPRPSAWPPAASPATARFAGLAEVLSSTASGPGCDHRRYSVRDSTRRSIGCCSPPIGWCCGACQPGPLITALGAEGDPGLPAASAPAAGERLGPEPRRWLALAGPERFAAARRSGGARLAGALVWRPAASSQRGAGAFWRPASRAARRRPEDQ